MKKVLKTTIVCALGMSLVGCSSNSKEIILKDEVVKIEYGEKLKDNPKEYLDVEKMSNEVVKDTKMSSDLDTMNFETDYPNVGEYKLIFENKDLLKETKVIVEDTTAPKFVLKEKYEVVKGKNINLDVFEVEDLSDVTLGLDDSKVDYNKIGKYEATVIATDIHDNKAESKIVIEIKEEKDVKEDSSTDKKVEEQEVTKKSKNTSKDKSTDKSQDKSKDKSKDTSKDKPKDKDVAKDKPSSDGSKPTTPKPDPKPSNPKPTEPKPTEPEKPKPTEPEKPKCNHDRDVGNTKKWFNTKQECQTYYREQVRYWDNLVETGKITWEEYLKQVPGGYSAWSCAGCGKWTVDFTYD